MLTLQEMGKFHLQSVSDHIQMFLPSSDDGMETFIFTTDMIWKDGVFMEFLDISSSRKQGHYVSYCHFGM